MVELQCGLWDLNAFKVYPRCIISLGIRLGKCLNGKVCYFRPLIIDGQNAKFALFHIAIGKVVMFVNMKSG